MLSRQAIDATNKTLRIERAIERSSTGLFFKLPKTKRGTRTIAIMTIWRRY